MFVLLIAVIAGCSLASAADSAPSENAAQTWEKLTASAVRALKAGAPAEAERLCSEAMKMVSDAGPGDTRPAKTLMLQGEILRWQKQMDLAEQSFKNAVTVCEKAVGTNHSEMIYPLESLANFYYFTKVQYELVVPLYQRILNIVEHAPAPSNMVVANRARNLADVYQLLGRHAQAEPLYQQALALAEKDNNDVTQYLLTSAGFYRAWGKCDQAVPLAARALKIREMAAGSDAGIDARLDLAVCLDSLGEIYLACGTPDKAEPVYVRSLAIAEKIAGPDSPDVSPRLTGLATAHRGQRKYHQAETEYKRALAITEKGMGTDAPEVATILEKYAALLKEMKRPEESTVQLNRADSIRKRAATE